MTQNPYAQTEPSGLGGGYDELPMTPERTSALAITSLVFSILAIPACCFLIGIVPGLIGTLLGIIALVAISGSRGRLGGKGLAISGIIIGLVFTVLSTFGLLGMGWAIDTFTDYTDVVAAAETGDVQGVRGMLTRSSNGALTDERIVEWTMEIDLALGGMKQPPSGMFQFFTWFGEVGDQMNSFNSVQMGEYPPPNSVAPIPVQFENGKAVVIVIMDQGGETVASSFPALKNVGVVDPANGDVIWLIDPDLAP